MRTITLLTGIAFLTMTGLAAADTAQEAWQLRVDGQIHTAKALLEAHVKEHPGDARAQFELARIGFLTATETKPPKLKDAQQAIDAAIAAAPDNAQYHYWAGTIASYRGIVKAHKLTTAPGMAGQLKKAIREYKKALAIDPGYHEARLALFGCYDRLPWLLGGREKKAEAELAELQERDPVYGAEAACQKHPRKTEAQKIAIWEGCIAAHPERADAHARLALLLARTDSGLERAEEHARQAREMDSEQTYPYLMLARAYARAGKLDEAERAANVYLESDLPAAQTRAWGLEALARIAKEHGDTERAEAFAREAQALSPSGFRPELPLEELFGAP